jgi:hypothetical protein
MVLVKSLFFFFFFDFLVWCKLPIYFLYLQIKRIMRYNPIEEIDKRMIAADVPVADLCTRAGLSYTTFYRWLQNPPRTLQLINRLHDELETLEAERGITATDEKLCNACGAIVAAVPQPQDATCNDQPQDATCDDQPSGG